MLKDTSRGRGKDVSLFERGQIIGMHQRSKEIAGTTIIELRTVQHMIKNWKDNGEPSSSRKECGQNNGALECINSESKSISTCTMQRQLKGFGTAV